MFAVCPSNTSPPPIRTPIPSGSPQDRDSFFYKTPNYFLLADLPMTHGIQRKRRRRRLGGTTNVCRNSRWWRTASSCGRQCGRALTAVVPGCRRGPPCATTGSWTRWGSARSHGPGSTAAWQCTPNCTSASCTSPAAWWRMDVCKKYGNMPKNVFFNIDGQKLNES